MNRIYVQALYLTKQGRTYRSQVRVVGEGQELFDFENELKYQMAMKDYVIEFVNDRGHKQFVQPSDIETIIAAQLGYEVQPVASVQEERLEPQTPSWAQSDMQGTVRVSVDPANEQGVAFVAEHELDDQGKFNTHLPFPEPPVQKVRVKPTGDDPDNETTQEIKLPFAAPNAVSRTIAQNNPQGAASAPFSGPIKMRMGAGTDPARPRP